LDFLGSTSKIAKNLPFDYKLYFTFFNYLPIIVQFEAFHPIFFHNGIKKIIFEAFDLLIHYFCLITIQLKHKRRTITSKILKRASQCIVAKGDECSLRVPYYLKKTNYYSMKKITSHYFSFRNLASAVLLTLLVFPFSAGAQVIGLDNWYNRETTKTGQPFHYLWTDTENSGYSQWGELFKKQGATLTTLEQAADKKNLENIDIYLIVDPDTTTESKLPNYILPADVKAIKNWVNKGGVLVLMANDAPNCEFTHLNQLAAEFGIYFNHVSLHPVLNRKWDMGAFVSLPEHPIFKGVSKIYMKEISSFELKSPAKPILAENGVVYMAESKVGKGLVVAIGDPWIYNEYIDHKMLPDDFENLKAAENFTEYLIKNARTAK
jgi:hypothetical protein